MNTSTGAAGRGAMVVVPNYALCPAVSIEQITWQMVHALQWVWRHAAAHGGDPQRIVVAGQAAGGHLAALMLSCRWKQVADDLPSQLVGGALAISGVYDLEPLRTLDSKKRILGMAAREGWRLVFEHDHDLPMGVLHEDGGKLRAVACAVEA